MVPVKLNSELGCNTTNTPIKPTSTADQRQGPTFSPNKGPDKAAMIIGAMKTITITLTNGSSLSAVKKVNVDRTISIVLAKCH